MNMNRCKQIFLLFCAIVFGCVSLFGVETGDLITVREVIGIKRCTEARISPDGSKIAYIVSVPREAKDNPGSAYRELYLVSTKSGKIKPYITGKVNIHNIQWSPDGSKIAFITNRGEKAKNQVWAISVAGGEAFRVTNSKNDVNSFAWHPKANEIAYISSDPPTKRERQLKEKGYGFIFYEENLKHKNLYLINLDRENQPEQLTEGKTVWNFVFSTDGKTIAAAISDKNLIDQRYMFRKIYLLDIKTKKLSRLTANPGKLGQFVFSPDNSAIVYTAALERKDHALSQVYVIDIASKKEINLTIPGFKGHVDWAGWKNNKTIFYHAGEGVWPTLSVVPAKGGQRKVILHTKDSGITFRNADFTTDFKQGAVIGSSPRIPADLFLWKYGQKLKRLTDLNPWLGKKRLGKQEVIRYQARDEQEVEGLLIYPVDYKEGKKYPLIVTVHGGPESHYSNAWVSRYSTPGQVLAARGYAVFYPNYRASTGYGVKFALAGYEDAAGKEFDDIADGIEFLIKKGIADPDRVGLGGGSYGGYASGWFATYYTKYVRAVCMFVGISNIVSKRGTTDIPYEELYVHSGKKLEEMWEFSLKRSPVYWAHQSKTATLIFGGTNDTRVHPSQSLELYRRMKMNDHPAVRLVQYPGEGHGNRKQPGKLDVIYRVLDWFDWYVKDKKPLTGPLPPLDISDKYGLELK